LLSQVVLSLEYLELHFFKVSQVDVLLFKVSHVDVPFFVSQIHVLSHVSRVDVFLFVSNFFCKGV